MHSDTTASNGCQTRPQPLAGPYERDGKNSLLFSNAALREREENFHYLCPLPMPQARWYRKTVKFYFYVKEYFPYPARMGGRACCGNPLLCLRSFPTEFRSPQDARLLWIERKPKDFEEAEQSQCRSGPQYPHRRQFYRKKTLTS